MTDALADSDAVAFDHSVSYMVDDRGRVAAEDVDNVLGMRVPVNFGRHPRGNRDEIEAEQVLQRRPAGDLSDAKSAIGFGLNSVEQWFLISH